MQNITYERKNWLFFFTNKLTYIFNLIITNLRSKNTIDFSKTYFTKVVIGFLFFFIPFTIKAQCVVNTINADFEFPEIFSTPTYVNQDAYSINQLGWRTTATDGILEFWKNGSLYGRNAYAGSQFVELNATQASGLYQDYDTSVATYFEYSFAHMGREGVDVMELRAGPPQGPFVPIKRAETGTDWQLYSGTYKVPAGQTTTRFIFMAVSSTTRSGVIDLSIGNFLDAINFKATIDLPSLVNDLNLVISNNSSEKTICYNTQTSFTATGLPGSTFYWYDSNGTVLLYQGPTFTTPVLNENTSYKVKQKNISNCESSFMEIKVIVKEPIVTPIIAIIPATCLAEGSSKIDNYIYGNTYIFSPTGPSVNTIGLITGMAIGEEYTVTSVNTNCTSEPAAGFKYTKQLTTPTKPILSAITQPTLANTEGSFTITNYDETLNYTILPSIGVNQIGNKVTAPVGSYTMTANLGNCSSAAEDFIINPQPLACYGEMQTILKDDFGSGIPERGPRPSATDFSTAYNFSASGTIGPNSFGVTKNANGGNSSWSSGGDHTTGKNGDGYMLVFDANTTLGSVFYEKKYTGLCSGSICTFSIYAANLVPTSYSGFSVKPMVKIDLINPLNGIILKSMTSSELELSQKDELLWNELSLSFTIPVGLDAVTVRVSNGQGNTNVSGNDVAFDDVSFSICVPSLTIQTEKVCIGESTTLLGNIDNPTTTEYNYQWQQFNTTEWLDIKGGISKEYTTEPLYQNKKYRIRYAQSGIDITNNNNLKCSGSKEVVLQVTQRAKANDINIETIPNICEGSQTTINASSNIGSNFYWYDSPSSNAILLATSSSYDTGILTSSKTYYLAVSGEDYCENNPEDRKVVSVNVSPMPAIPTFSTITQPTCSTVTGSFTITNYDDAYTYVINPSTEVVRNGNTVTAPKGEYTITATFGTCTSEPSQKVIVVVQPATPTASITYPASSYSTTEGITSINKIGQAGGKYTATPAGLSIDENTGEINPNSSLENTYTVTYAFTNGTCSNTAQTIVKIGSPKIASWLLVKDQNGNGTVEPGETLTFMLRLANIDPDHLTLKNITGSIDLPEHTSLVNQGQSIYVTPAKASLSYLTYTDFPYLWDLSYQREPALVLIVKADCDLTGVNQIETKGRIYIDGVEIQTSLPPVPVSNDGTWTIVSGYEKYLTPPDLVDCTNPSGCPTALPTADIKEAILNILNPDAVCSGSTVDLSTTVGTNSTPGVLTYWTDASATISLANPTAVAVSGTYYIKSTSSQGCEIIKPVMLTVNPKPQTITTTENICFGESFVWDVDGKTYTASGTYNKFNNGCTADQELILTVGEKPQTITTTKEICFGESFVWDVDGKTYSASGTYNKFNNGCTADQELILTVGEKPQTISRTENICFGESFVWDVDGKTYTASGTYNKFNNGCTADQELILTVGEKPQTIITIENICFGESFVWDIDGKTYTESGTFNKFNNGCTADQELILTVGEKPQTITTTENICFGESFVWDVDGKTYSASGTYNKFNNGCTADQELILTVGEKPETITTRLSICYGESLVWEADKKIYTASGTYILKNNGCTADQVLELTVGEKPKTITTTKDICFGESFVWNVDGKTYTESGTYIVNNNGCNDDRILKLNVAQLLGVSIVADSLIPEFCSGDNEGSFKIEITGGMMPYLVRLDRKNGTYTPITANEHTFIELSGENHKVYIKDALDCTTELEVYIPTGITINPVANVSYSCLNDVPVNSVTITVDSSINLEDLDYSLDGVNYQSENTFVNVPAGKQSIKVRHTNGCVQSTKDFIIDYIEPLALTLANGELNEITATAAGGNGQYRYSFNNEAFSTTNKFIIYKSGDYTVTATDQNGCTTTTSKYFEYIDVCIPNHFTPNGDGINDEWGPGCTTQYKNLTFTVFDRYGRIIGNYKYGQTWDGKYNGAELSSGDYWYVLKLNDNKDNREFVGHFTLYR